MTYTSITSSTLVSDLPDILNGVTTRTAQCHLLTGPATAATLSTAFVAAWAFDLNDKTSCTITIPPRVDTAVAPSLQLALMPLTSETGKEAAIKFSSDTVTSSNNPVAGTGAQSATSADIVLGTTAGTVQLVTIPLSVDVYQTATSGQIVGILERTAIADGTELTGQVGVIGAALVYTIER